MRIGRKQENILVYSINRHDLDLTSIIQGIEGDIEITRSLYESYRRALDTLVEHSLIVKYTSRPNIYELTETGVKMAKNRLSNLRLRQNALLSQIDLQRNIPGEIDEFIDTLEANVEEETQQEIRSKEDVKKEIRAVKEKIDEEIMELHNSKLRFLLRHSGYEKTYPCLQCKKSHKNTSNIGGQHGKHNKWKYPIKLIVDSFKLFKRESIPKTVAIQRILDTCGNFDMDEKYPHYYQLLIIEHGARYLREIDSRNPLFLDFLEQYLVGGVLDRETSVKLLRIHFPKKANKIIEKLPN